MFGSGALRRFDVADVLEVRLEEILAVYEGRLADMQSPLIAEADSREQLRAHARAILRDVASSLRGREEPPEELGNGNYLSEAVGASRARELVHPSESIRAVIALSEATLSVVVENLPPSNTSRSEVAAVALAVQRSIIERVARASVSYGGYLLERIHASHAEERRRIGRELHDRVAHSIMVVFRNLELYEMYQEQDPERARSKLEDAKAMAQQALKDTRELSKELREASAEGGLGSALTDYLRLIAPAGIEARVSIDGDESFVPPHVRGELFLILREGIRNAAAHSGARHMSVELSVTRDLFRALVEDDGRGFQPDEVASSGGTGLASMKERASLLGGALSLTSRPGSGTRIEIVVPLPRSRR
jgi:signal transduction histidine kinase